MKITNITISNINLTNNSAKLTFNITECTKNVNVHLKINENEYVSIYTNKTNGTLSYDLTNLRRGINNLFLKLVSSDEEYITDTIVAKIKENGSIKDFKCSYTDSTGKYILEFLLSGDTHLKYSIDINVDNTGYKRMYDAQIVGIKSYEGTGLSLGSHKCKLKINDGYDTYETSEYTFNVTNHKPLLSDLAIVDIKDNGSCSICYGVNDVESSSLSHSLTIDNSKRTITPTKVNDFYSYSLTGLSIGKHTLMISVSDGKDTVSTNTLTIEIFQSTTNNKRLLEIAKTRYDFSYQQLKRIIETTISDNIFNYETENEVIIKSQNYYKEMYSDFNRVSMTAIDIIGNKKITNAKADLNNEINDVYNAVDTLENTMETTFKDGILTDSEKDSLRNTLNLVAKEKVDIDKDYTNLYNNADLTGNAKTNLKSTYDTFTSRHNTLTTTVNNIINKTGIVNNTDKSNLDTAFANWRTELGNYRDASMKAIDAIARKKVDDSADVVNKYWSEIILEPGGIQSRVGSLETKVTGTGGIDERLRSAEQKITTNGITNLIKDEFYTKEVADEIIGERIDEELGSRIEEAVGEGLDKIIDENIKGLQGQINKNKTEIETTKSSIAEHTTALNNITSRVSTTESNITKINGNVTSVTNRITAAEQKITETAIINTVSSTIDNKINTIEVGDRNLLKNSNVNIVNNTAYNICILYFGNEKPVANETYTITLKGSLASTKTHFMAYNSGGNVRIGDLKSIGNNLYRLTASWNIGSSSNTSLYIYVAPNTQSGASSVEWVKLVKGNKSTSSWTAAPEDMETKVETLSSTVTQTTNSFTAKITQNEKDIASLKLTDSQFDVTIKNKADSSNIISKINASTEGITINSNKINISGLVTISNLSTSGKTTINGSNITTGTIDASKATIKNINASNITTGTLSGNYISGGTIKGVTLQTYANNSSAGVRIYSESMYLNGTKLLYHTSDNFRIAADQTLTLSSPKDIYLMAGLSSNESQTGTNTVVIPQATLRAQKLTVVNNATLQGACAVSGALSCASISCIGATSSTNGYTSNNGGVVVTGSITTNSGNVYATAGQVQSKTLYVTSTSTLSGTVTCGGSLNATAGTITGNNVKANNNMNCKALAVSGDFSVGATAYIKYLYVNGTWVASDKRKKMDIKYVDKDTQSIAESGLIAPNVNINKDDMHEFIEALPIASYRYIEDVEKQKDITHYGLVVQDVLYTKVGSELVRVLDEEKQIGDEGDYMGYSQEKLLTFMCGALQREIEYRKELEKRVEELENKSNK